LHINADNKALISFNKAAIDRRTQPNRLFSEQHHIEMHDYPQPEKVIPSAYLVRTPPAELGCYMDDLNRKRIVTSRAGPVYTYLRSSHYNVANIEVHLNDLYSLHNLYPKKGAIALFVDDGSDWEFNLRSGKCSIVNIYEYGCFWLKSRVNVFFVAAYLPENHHQGPIGRSFASLTNALAGTNFPLHLDGKSEDEVAALIDAGMEFIASSWEGRKYDGFDVHSTVVRCKEEQQFSDLPDIREQFKHKKFSVDVEKMLKFFLTHCVKTPWTLLFLPCFNCEICNSTAWIKSDKLDHFLRNEHGGRMPLPSLDSGSGT
jgi:hypothetical protein